MKLRPYQNDAFKQIISDIKLPGNSLVVMPGGAGKSHVIAAAATLFEPVLILQPSRELLEQNRNKLMLLVDPEEIGTYSASFNERTIRRFTFATIQSVYKKPELFEHVGLVLIDEAHNLAPRKLGSMYTSFLKAIGSPKVIGMTATPFRLEIGYHINANGELEASTMLKLINRMRHKSHKEMFWKRIIYHIQYKELEKAGYLAPIEYIHEPLLPYNEIPINNSYSDYNLDLFAQSIVGREAQIISTIGEAQKRYKSVLVFCATTDQARDLQATIKGSGLVLGETDTKERKNTIQGFKTGSIKTVFNFGTLTTGFDHPALDCIILLRPTRSIPLYIQILSRLSRRAPGKVKGTVIDLTGTCKAIGRLDTFEMYRNSRGLWDLKTEKHDNWHDRILFSRVVNIIEK